MPTSSDGGVDVPHGPIKRIPLVPIGIPERELE